MEKKEKVYLIITIIMLTGMAVFAFVNGNCQSFWADELASIGYIRTGVSFGEMIAAFFNSDPNLPMYSMILYWIYRIMPYGEKYLLIFSVFCCVLGIFMTGAAVKKLKSIDAGFLAICIGVSSSALLWQVAWELRGYGPVFLLASAVLLTYVNKSIDNSRKNLVWYTIALFFFLWTHWFACLLTALYGLTDLILMLTKKYKWKNIIPYLVSGGGLLPWLIMLLINQQSEIQDYWVSVPQWKNTVWTVLFLLSGNRLLWYLCMLTGVVIAGIWVYKLVRKKNISDIKENICLQSAVAIGWVIGIVFIYSYYINPKGSLYVERYFMVIVPHIFLITVCGLCGILNLGKYAGKRLRDSGRKRIGDAVRIGTVSVIGLFICFLLVICYRNSYKAIRKPFEDYRAAAQFLVEDGGIWEEESLLVGKNRYCMLDGFVEYYIEKKGYDSPAHVMDGAVNHPEETRFYPNYTEYGEDGILKFDTIYNLKIHMGMDEELKAFVEKNYNLVQDSQETGIEIWQKK